MIGTWLNVIIQFMNIEGSQSVARIAFLMSALALIVGLGAVAFELIPDHQTSQFARSLSYDQSITNATASSSAYWKIPWATYQNQAHEFELQYPAGWIVYENPGGPALGQAETVTFRPYRDTEEGGFMIVFSNIGNQDLQSFLNQIQAGHITVASERFIDIDCRRAVQKELLNGSSRYLTTETYLKSGQTLFTFRDLSSQLYPHILSTFRFAKKQPEGLQMRSACESVGDPR